MLCFPSQHFGTCCKVKVLVPWTGENTKHKSGIHRGGKAPSKELSFKFRGERGGRYTEQILVQIPPSWHLWQTLLDPTSWLGEHFSKELREGKFAPILGVWEDLISTVCVKATSPWAHDSSAVTPQNACQIPPFFCPSSRCCVLNRPLKRDAASKLLLILIRAKYPERSCMPNTPEQSPALWSRLSLQRRAFKPFTHIFKTVYSPRGGA